MAKARIGHFVEAQVLEALGVDYIDESEVLTPADEAHHINKHPFKVPFVCGCRDLGEALRRIGEGAAMIRTKGEAGTGNVVEAVRHMRQLWDDIRRIQNMPDDELLAAAKELGAPLRACEGSARPRQAARRELRRRRHRHAGRRGADDAARRRGRLRRLRHLQVGEPGEDGEGHRQGDDALPRRRRSSPRSRAAPATRCRASRSARSPRTRSSPSAAGSPRRAAALNSGSTGMVRAEALDWPSLGPDDALHMPKYRGALTRVRRFCLALPDAAEKISRGHMPVFTSGGKNFAIAARGEHRASMWIAAAPGAQAVLVGAEPERYYVPAYVGKRGWVGAWLDGDVDWPALEQLLGDGHAMVAAKRRTR